MRAIRRRRMQEPGCLKAGATSRTVLASLLACALWTAGPAVQSAMAQGKAPAPNATLSTEEMKLYTLLMAHRKANGLASIPLSPSLTTVAKTHVHDLVANRPVTKQCNMHSWSGKGKGAWSACCYTEDHARSSCMWNKPKELTSYKGNGYEISHGQGQAGASDKNAYRASAEDALKGWKSSGGHNAVIVNSGIWSSSKWQAVGVGIQGGYAVAWFGHEKDGARKQ